MTIFKMNSENLTHLCIQSDRYNMVMFQILQDQSSLSESYTVYRGGNKSQVLKDKWESLILCIKRAERGAARSSHCIQRKLHVQIYQI